MNKLDSLDSLSAAMRQIHATDVGKATEKKIDYKEKEGRFEVIGSKEKKQLHKTQIFDKIITVLCEESGKTGKIENYQNILNGMEVLKARITAKHHRPTTAFACWLKGVFGVQTKYDKLYLQIDKIETLINVKIIPIKIESSKKDLTAAQTRLEQLQKLSALEVELNELESKQKAGLEGHQPKEAKKKSMFKKVVQAIGIGVDLETQIQNKNQEIKKLKDANPGFYNIVNTNTEINEQQAYIKTIKDTIDRYQLDLAGCKGKIQTYEDIEELNQAAEDAAASAPAPKPITAPPAGKVDKAPTIDKGSQYEIGVLTAHVETSVNPLSEQSKSYEWTAHFEYMTKAMIGFGIGQQFEMDKILKKINWQGEIPTTHKGESTLEGSSGCRNIAYLRHVVQKMLETKHDAESKSAFTKLAKMLDKSAKLAVMQEVASKSKERSEQFAKHVQWEVGQLEPGEHLLLPAGNNEHEIMLKFTKLEDGNVQVTLYNTGDGSELFGVENWSDTLQTKGVFGGAKALALGKQYSTSETYEPIDINQTNVTHMIAQLTQYKAQDVPIKNCHDAVRAVLQHPKKNPAVRNQVAGTCSFSALTLAVEDVLKEKKQIELFQHGLNSYLSKDYEETIKYMAKRKNRGDIPKVELAKALLELHNKTYHV